jgi:hypothetical protein
MTRELEIPPPSSLMGSTMGRMLWLQAEDPFPRGSFVQRGSYARISYEGRILRTGVRRISIRSGQISIEDEKKVIIKHELIRRFTHHSNQRVDYGYEDGHFLCSPDFVDFAANSYSISLSRCAFLFFFFFFLFWVELTKACE